MADVAHDLALVKDGGLWRSRCTCGWQSLVCRSKAAAERSTFYHPAARGTSVTSKRSSRPAFLKRAPGALRAACYDSTGQAALDTLARTRKRRASTVWTRVASRQRREEKLVKDAVRAACVTRDGYCRLSRTAALGPCGGPSEWSHLEGRWKTVNMAPTRRHRTTHSAMLCRDHHWLVDRHQITHEARTKKGADGPLRWTRGGVTYEEAA